MEKENWNTFVPPEGIDAGDPIMEYQLPLELNPEAKQFLANIAIAEASQGK